MAEYIDCDYMLLNYEQANLIFHGNKYDGPPALDEETRRQLLESSVNPVKYGELLFEALFPTSTDLFAGYRIALATAIRENKHLRFRIQIDASAPVELHNINWELLYDARKKIALGRAGDIVFSRYTLAQGRPFELIANKPKLLVVSSNPSDLPKDMAPVTSESLRESLDTLRRWIDIEYLEGRATPNRIRDQFRAHGFQLLHIQAHGIKSKIVLETDEGKANFIEAVDFWETLEGIESLKLLTLITCYSSNSTEEDPFAGIAPRLARQGLPAVVAMQNTISMSGAALFCKYFYQNLIEYGLVDVAANEARKRMYLANNPPTRDWSRPTVFMRLSEGKLWGPINVNRPPMPVPKTKFNWNMVLPRLIKGVVVPILGPGINHGLLPSDNEISERWAYKYNYPGDDINDLPRVAKFVEMEEGSPAHKENLIDVLKDDLIERRRVKDRDLAKRLPLTKVIERMSQTCFDGVIDDPHRILAELPISTYITTTFDSFTMEAIKYLNPNKSPKREYCYWRKVTGDEKYSDDKSDYQNLKAEPDKPLIFHIYGMDEQPKSLVLTEDDYLDFLRNVSKDDWRIPQLLKYTLTEAVLIFLGFNIRDLNFRVLFKGLIDQLKDDPLGRVAVLQIDPEGNYREKMEKLNELQDFMGKDCDNLDIAPYWGTVRDFLIELRKKYTGN